VDRIDAQEKNPMKLVTINDIKNREAEIFTISGVENLEVLFSFFNFIYLSFKKGGKMNDIMDIANKFNGLKFNPSCNNLSDLERRLVNNLMIDVRMSQIPPEAIIYEDLTERSIIFYVLNYMRSGDEACFKAFNPERAMVSRAELAYNAKSLAHFLQDT